MAKDKKRGFFSWLGLGSQDNPAESDNSEEQTAHEEPVEQTDGLKPTHHGIDEHISAVVSEISVPEHSATEAEACVEPHILNLELEQQIKNIDEQLDEDSKPSESIELVEKEEFEHQHSLNLSPIESPKPIDTLTDVASHESIELVEELEHQQAEDEQSGDNSNHKYAIPADEIVSTGIVTLMADDERESFEEQNNISEQERPTKEGFFARLKRSLLRTKQNLGSGFFSLFRNRKIDDDLFDELEEQLLIADVGVNTTRKIIDSLTQHVDRKKLNDAEALYDELKHEMSEILEKVSAPLDIESHKPFVILMVGVNGVGKTTTIGKLARQFQQQGKSVMLAAGDTFRAAAVEQLQVWGQRNKIAVIAQHTGADSASVIYDGLQAAKARNVDILIADTAGRLQNKSHLMEELKKIVRVMQKLDPQAPHEIMLTIDASTGQNAVSQVKLFNEAVGLTGIALTKLDGTAKGGVIFAVADQFDIPIRYIGVGEGIEDLRPFKSDDFIEALFAREDPS